MLAIVRRKTEIVGVGAIKRIRDYYAAGIASRQKSGFDFDKAMPEVGYIAVDDRHFEYIVPDRRAVIPQSAEQKRTG